MAESTDVLLRIVAHEGLTHYKEEYRTPDQLNGSLGCAIASYCEYDWEKIIEIFLASLEDANCHSLYKIVEEYAKAKGLLKA